ncbi:MAG: tripartite tricarboxylate transporter substrate-binding protein [Thermodesulfobacteriota bacterium]|nr:tripartite tricarboxylate transporter substrate-binding protein [Thermodesulfobacteriota bacterium]
MGRKIFSSGRGILLGVVAIGLVFGVLANVKAAPSGPYFQKKVIIFVVPFPAGGGTDVWGRMIARYLGQYIPGNPKIVIRNMPGAGTIIGGNTVWNSKRNGLTVLATSGGVVMENITRPKGIEFKLQEMYPMYSSPIGLVYFAKAGLAKEPKDVFTAKGLIFGHMPPTGGVSSGFVWAKELLEFPTEKMILAYSGSGDTRLAFLSGELNCTGDSTFGYNAAMKPYADRGEIVPIFQSGMMDENGNIVREPAAPNVPTAPELYEQVYGKKPSGPIWEIYKLVVGSRTYGKCIVLPPKTPPELLDIYREAVAKMVKDPKFLADAEKENPQAPHFFGKALAQVYPKGVSAPADVVEHMKKILWEKYKARLE